MIFLLGKYEDILTGETSMNLSKISLEFLNHFTIYSDTKGMLFFQNEVLYLFLPASQLLFSERRYIFTNQTLLWVLQIRLLQNLRQKSLRVFLFLKRKNLCIADIFSILKCSTMLIRCRRKKMKSLRFS